VFDAARLVLQSGDRFHVKFTVPADSPVKLCTIPADGSVWLGREEAVSHFLHSEGIKEFYRVEETELEEPKGVFTSIAVCGMTGEILGPASHHSYQTTLHRIHRERFSDMRFEDYKRRVRTENSPEIIEKWKDSQKRGQVWIHLTPALDNGAEPLKLKSRSEMETHFRKTHAETLVHETNEAWVAGNIPKQHLSPALYHALRRGVEDARKHLLPVAQLLCSGFEGQGLKLFKRRGGKLWVSRTRPKALDNSVVLSVRIARMLEVIKAKPGIAVKDLVEIIAPTVQAPGAAVPAEPAATTTDAEPAVAESAVTEAPAVTPDESAPVTAEAQNVEATAPAPADAPQQHSWSTDQLHALQDLHWLNSEGYVIEYSDGIVFIGVTEPPPPKPKPAKPVQAAPSPASATVLEETEAKADTLETVEQEGQSAETNVAADAAIAEPESRQGESADAGVSRAALHSLFEDNPFLAEPPPEMMEEPAVAPFSFMDDAEESAAASAEKSVPDADKA
jgi:hypothetical protein